MPQTTPLKRILVNEGRKQSWLAARTGLHQVTMSRIVNGWSCDLETQRKIAAVLGRDIADVFPDGDAMGEAA